MVYNISEPSAPGFYTYLGTSPNGANSVYCHLQRNSDGWNTHVMAYYFTRTPTCPIAAPPYTFNGTTRMCERERVCPPHASGTPCACDEGYKWNADRTSCIEQRFTLKLTPESATIEPGQSYSFSAAVVDQDNEPPTFTVPISVKVEVDPTSGGHDHDDAARPKGSASPISGDRSFLINFTATEVSGTHVITATCDLCAKTASARVDVKVEGLKPIPAFPFYALVEGNGDVIGARPGWHTDNHNLTPAAAAVLMKIAANYRFNPKFLLRNPLTNGVVFPPVLHVNDASLPWGGVYDICARPNACPEDGVIAWHKPHAEHRRGTVVDVRANGGDGSIPVSNKETFKRQLKRYQLPFLHEAQGTSNEHLHIRLMGKKE